MKIKIVLLTIGLLSLGLTSFSQDYKKEIELRHTEYQSALINRDFEKAVTYVADVSFEFGASKELMISIMRMGFNNRSVSVEIVSTKVSGIEDKELIEQKYYSLVTYSQIKIVKFPEDKEKAKSGYKPSHSLILAFEDRYGSENVRYNRENNYYEVYGEMQTYAVSDDGKTGWKFFDYDKKENYLLDQLLPKQLLEKKQKTGANK